MIRTCSTPKPSWNCKGRTDLPCTRPACKISFIFQSPATLPALKKEHCSHSHPKVFSNQKIDIFHFRFLLLRVKTSGNFVQKSTSSHGTLLRPSDWFRGKKVRRERHFVYANEQILQSDWSRAILMRCILLLIGYRPYKRPLLLVHRVQSHLKFLKI